MSPKKSEKFCSTCKSTVCDKGKLVLEPNRSPNFFNYENITYCLPMLTRACADFSRAISRASRTAATISAWTSARGSRPGCESGGSGESRRTGAAAERKLAPRCACRAGTPGHGRVTSRARRDSYRYVKPCTNHRSERFAGCRRENQRRRARQ